MYADYGGKLLLITELLEKYFKVVIPYRHLTDKNPPPCGHPIFKGERAKHSRTVVYGLWTMDYPLSSKILFHFIEHITAYFPLAFHLLENK